MSVDALRAGLDQVCAAPAVNVIVDFSQVDFFDVSAINALAEAGQRLATADRQLTVAGLSPWQQRILRLAHLEELLTIAADTLPGTTSSNGSSVTSSVPSVDLR